MGRLISPVGKKFGKIMENIDWLNVGGIVVFVLAVAPFVYAIFGQNDE